MKKINLSSVTKLGLLELEKNQFTIPKFFLMDSISEKFLYKNVNGENQKTDEIEGYIINAYDFNTYSLLLSNGIDTSEIKPITIFIADISQNLVEQFENGKNKFELQDFKIVLNWNNNAKRYDGSVKLIANTIKFSETK